MLTIPKRHGSGIGSAELGSRWPGPLQDRPDTLRIREYVELFDPDADPLDPGIGKADRANPLGEPLAQIDMPGTSDLADRGDDLLVIDDAPAVFSGEGVGCG